MKPFFLLTIVLTVVLILSLCGRVFQIREGARSRNPRYSTSVGSSAVLKEVRAMRKSVEGTVKRLDKRVNLTEEYSYKNFCMMNKVEIPENDYEKNTMNLCKRKAARYNWDRDYWNWSDDDKRAANAEVSKEKRNIKSGAGSSGGSSGGPSGYSAGEDSCTYQKGSERYRNDIGKWSNFKSVMKRCGKNIKIIR